MDINELTIGQAKELANLFGNKNENKGIQSLVGSHVIVRTYSAGVFYGVLLEKDGSEVVLKDARRLYYWKTNGGISLSEVALNGLHSDSKVCAPIDMHWLNAIEIIKCSEEAVLSMNSQKNHVV